MNSVVLYLGRKSTSRHSKMPKTIGFTMVLEPCRVHENRKLKNQRALEENPKRILTRVRVHFVSGYMLIIHPLLMLKSHLIQRYYVLIKIPALSAKKSIQFNFLWWFFAVIERPDKKLKWYGFSGNPVQMACYKIKI